MKANMSNIARAAGVAMASLMLAACVTINIYFPAAAAEKAADKIIEEVWQGQQKSQPDQPAVKEQK